MNSVQSENPVQQLPGFETSLPSLPPVTLDQFEGPLDMLLHLIRSQKMDIFNIPIAMLTAQYLEMVEAQKIDDLNIAGDYLVMASTLMQLKSRMLLPRPEVDDEGNEVDPREALVAQLIAYEQFRLLAEEINALPRLDRDIFIRRVFPEVDLIERPLPAADLNALLTAFSKVLSRVGGEVRHKVMMEPISVREKMCSITQFLKRGSASLDELLGESRTRESLVATVLAILELWRQQIVLVLQEQCYASVRIMLKETLT